MVAYAGGKHRHGKAIYRTIVQIAMELGIDRECYFEPFAGMCGVARHFSADGSWSVILTDLNPNVIALLREIQQRGVRYLPTHCTQDMYNQLKHSREVSARKGFVGVACSFNNTYFEGFRKPAKSQRVRDYTAQFRRGLISLGQDLQGARILNASSYAEHTPENCVVYCDPPYAGNHIGQPYFVGFDHDTFWRVMRQWSKKNLVFVSELTAPADFVCIWMGITRKTNAWINVPIEDKLFVHKSVVAKLQRRGVMVSKC